MTEPTKQCCCASVFAIACYLIRHKIDPNDYVDPDDFCECVCHESQYEDEQEL